MIAPAGFGAIFALIPLRFISFFAGLLASLIIIPWLIDAQRKRQAGQQVYEDAPPSHATKQGTPTMGGAVFAVAAVAGYGLSGLHDSLPLLLLVLAASAIGLADDLLILRAHRALGLRAREKFALLTLLAVAYVLWLGWTQPDAVYQSWFGGVTIALPAWVWFVFAVLAIVGTANAVNLTDGLDGLAAGVTIPVLIGLELIINYLRLPGGSIGDAVLGALVGFFWFNRYPARIFMGDTGSLALGALLAGMALESHALLLLPFFGIVFVIEALSVIAQVASYKSMRRRILLMSPLHHHFELAGWPETAVSSTFIVASVLASALTCVAWGLTYVR
jgi:phospho-N-acetylmuramoyl-pentapeptide-transferase